MVYIKSNKKEQPNGIANKPIPQIGMILWHPIVYRRISNHKQIHIVTCLVAKKEMDQEIVLTVE